MSDLATRIRVFKDDWKTRECLLKLEGLSPAQIEKERCAMLARYRLKDNKQD